MANLRPENPQPTRRQGPKPRKPKPTAILTPDIPEHPKPQSRKSVPWEMRATGAVDANPKGSFRVLGSRASGFRVYDTGFRVLGFGAFKIFARGFWI